MFADKQKERGILFERNDVCLNATLLKKERIKDTKGKKIFKQLKFNSFENKLC